jgi:superfamily II DNA helicase RecQ
LHAVLEKQTLLIIVLPTGRGKSLLFTLPAYIEEVGVTVVVVLY